VLNDVRAVSALLPPGTKLGKYDLIRQIAIGGMAELYLARTVGIEGFEKLVVLKRILPQYAANASFIEMFLDEARLAATLHHPHIAQVYDIGVDDGSYFFAMEYVHGEDLARVALTAREHGKEVPLEVAIYVVSCMASGLHYAHDRRAPDGELLGLVHRDVSPANCLVSYDGAVKVVDFGIAKATSAQARTDTGSLKGKIAYMSPEQCQGKVPLDRRSDVFSLGSILYELTTGRPVFTAETEFGVLSQLVYEDAAPPSQVRPGYPPGLEAIVVRMLRRDREDRFATALEAQQALDDFAYEQRLRASQLSVVKFMENLFAATLDEWRAAKEQGAFFVEQHVVRTLTGRADLAAPRRPKEDTVTEIRPAPEAPAVIEPTLREMPGVDDDVPSLRGRQGRTALVAALLGVAAAAAVAGLIVLFRDPEPPPPPPPVHVTATAPAPHAPAPAPAPVPSPPRVATTSTHSAPKHEKPARPHRRKPEAVTRKTWDSNSPFMPVTSKR
jgi:eukaryotic-like serine/threonine-protein kinase